MIYMYSKDKWKNTGKELGGAFTKFGKAFVRSTKHVVNKSTEWAEDDKDQKVEKPTDETSTKEETVFNDGTWRDTGKSLGKAFADLGKTIIDYEEKPSKEESKKDDSNSFDDYTVYEAK